MKKIFLTILLIAEICFGQFHNAIRSAGGGNGVVTIADTNFVGTTNVIYFLPGSGFYSYGPPWVIFSAGGINAATARGITQDSLDALRSGATDFSSIDVNNGTVEAVVGGATPKAGKIGRAHV
jgi:hypothetical protein